MIRSKLSGGVINVVKEDSTNGTITYMTVACIDGTIRKFVGRIILSEQLNINNATFEEYLMYKYCEALGDPELIDKHIRICKSMLGQRTDDGPTTTTLNNHLDWVNMG